ncbi:MAG: hypothetical protein LBC74_05915, partial [Planctomycetaceae bacterium]|nr:hypothetical protein [Planctomycetaceae bacterium]
MCSDIYYFIVRKNFVFFVLLVYQVFLILNMNFCVAEWTPAEEMVRQYQHIGEKDWGTVQSSFEKLLELERLEKISRHSLYESMCFLERIKVIDWSKTKKQEIADFLLATVIEMLNREDYLKNSYRQIPAAERMTKAIRWLPYDLLLSILETHGFLSETLQGDKLDMIWKKYAVNNTPYAKLLQNTLIQTVSLQMRFSESVRLLEKWKTSGIKFLTKEQITMIEHYILTHELAYPKSEAEAWENAWKQIKPEPITNVVSRPFSMMLFRKLIDMEKARRKIDSHIVMKIISSTDDFYKKYAFVQIALNIDRNNREMENSSEYYLQLESIIKNMSAEIDKNTQLKKIDNFLDYNKIDIERIIKSNKERKEYEEKKRIEDEKLRQKFNKRPNMEYKSAIIRPEDQGEDFSLLDNAGNFKRLTTAEDKFERWKAAKVLGTRFIDGQFKPTPAEQQKIDEYVAFLLTQFNTRNPGDAGDASDQLWRLWGLAIPGLLQGLKNKDRIIWNAALEHLVIFRNENIVDTLIKEYDQAGVEEYKQVLLDTLGKMRTKYDNRFPYRKMLNSKKSAELADKLITPFLERISVTEKSEVLQNAIKTAKKFIAEPIDSRMLSVDPATGEKKP